ncbi:conserved hypothetical protein [Tenacibaculum maritimum]|uniref:hypothetical protein n=1 Tax=Tenacibaculum maritimum TaxID=107401 RepID=UPI0012E6B73C|nr:hypothetical protein [Tenacibaculum maritimum]CAA0207045.1 conserved hypothetical protein [Tenacibaculum maritimum]
MEVITANKLESFLFDEENGFLIKYHFGKGIDLELLENFYNILENLKNTWEHKKEVPKDLVFQLITVSSSLYMDLSLYLDKEGYEDYPDILYNLDTAISMCLNPNIEDVHFETPLKDLGDI